MLCGWTIYKKVIRMKNLKDLQSKEINFDQPYNLSKIKRECFDMLVRSGRGEECAYESLGETITELNFADYTCDEYKQKLLEVVKDIIQLDNINFNLDKLYSFRNGLSA